MRNTEEGREVDGLIAMLLVSQSAHTDQLIFMKDSAAEVTGLTKMVGVAFALLMKFLRPFLYLPHSFFNLPKRKMEAIDRWLIEYTIAHIWTIGASFLMRILRIKI